MWPPNDLTIQSGLQQVVPLIPMIAACDVGSSKCRSAHRGLQRRSPSGEGLLVCCFVWFYLSNDTATSLREVKKKKYHAAVLNRPLLMEQIYGRSNILSSKKGNGATSNVAPSCDNR